MSNVHIVKGATRSELAPQYHLIPRAGLRRTALRFGLGTEKHGARGWLKAYKSEEDCRKWCDEAYNHMMEHMLKMGNGEDPTDDHLGAIGWAQSVLAHAEFVFGKPWTKLGVK